MKIYILFIFLLGLSIIVLLGFISSGSEIKIGSKAPKFSLLDQDGNNFSLEKYKGKKLVIYFFPRTSTPGWTKQACGFRDQYEVYKNNNIEIIGISYDARKKQKDFVKKHALNFLILSDFEKKVSKLYGVDTYFFPRRVSFLIDEKGIIFDVVKDVSLDQYAENIINIFKKNNLLNGNDDKE